MKQNIDITDKNGDTVSFGDRFIAYIIQPSLVPGTLVTVIEDTSPENIECDRNYDVEDEQGNRLWNAYTVIKNGVKLL